MSKSVTNATKAKFDSLLKLALSKKSSNVNKSTQNLVENLEEKANLNVEVTPNENSCSNDRSFILDRFLNENAIEASTEEVVVIKAPVPKPRRRQSNQQNSGSSKDTFVVKSAGEGVENHNDDSDKTFVVLEPANRRDSIVSDNSSARTYNVLKNEVGDILLHSPKPTNALHVVDVNNRRQEEDNDPPRPKPRRLSKETVLITKDEDADEPKSDVQDFEVEETSSSKTKVDYVDERKPKKQKRRKDKTKVEIDENKTDVCTYEKILCIVVHRTDALNLKSFVVHPLVKIHILDAETGAYLKKSNKSRSCVYSEENNDITYLLPVLTQNFNLQTKRSIYPDWEESIVINEDFDYVTNPKRNVIVFFEIVDFVSTSTDTRKGWHGIAWAFLKVTGKNNATNVNRKLRLQLYELGSHRKVLQTKCVMYDWWKEKKLKKYPSTLYVTLKSMPPPNVAVETLRSKTQGKKCLSVPCERLQNEDDVKSCEKVENERKEAVMVKLPKLHSEICKIPNKILAELKNEDEGCFVLKFSNGGAYLACAVFADDMYNILVYSTSNFEEFYKLPTHQMLIYNIKWSMDDSLLLSASADATVCIWNMKNFNLMQILPHPCYVYCTEMSAEGAIATGCYDNTLRIWIRSTNETDFSLYEELEGHDGYITSVCFTKDSRIVFSSDSVGCIIEWGQVDTNWSLLKAIRIPELREVVINQLILHRKEKRLIVHARDSVIRVIDIKNSCTLQWLEGATNSRMQTTCCVTRCCSYVLAGGEDGKIHIWNLDTGKSKALYRPYKDLSVKDLVIHCVDFHPSENILAFAHYGHGIPVFVYGYEKNSKDVHLTVTKEEMEQKRVKDELYHARKQKGHNNHKPEKKMLLKDILEKMDELIVTSNLH